MVSLDGIKAQLNKYVEQFRRPDLPNLSISGIYSLYPKEETPVQVEKEWPDSFPNAEKHGVYVIFGKELQVLYIGKASMNNTLGSRLGSYFSYADDKKTCKVKSEYWSETPKYIITISVPDNMSFEAPAIEEYLIKSLCASLPDNKIGTGK